MKASLIQQAFKSFIHPQLPLSERESQRLLSALTSSFRAQLEHNHPPPSTPTTCSAAAQHPLSPTTATDRHLASILTSPLLTKPIHQQLKARSKHPIALFEDQVAAGHANLNSARLCLEAFRDSLSALSPSESTVHIDRYAAGTRALRWLWTSASTHTLAFALDSRFLNHLAFFLVREGRVSALWELIDTPVPASANLSPRDASRRKGLLLASIVKTLLAAPAQPLEQATAAFFRALNASHASHASMASAGAYLTQALPKLALSSESDVVLYDQFVDAVPRWNKKHPDRAIYKTAILKLHHPTTPSADCALDFIRELRQLTSHPFLNPATATQKSTVFAFFFDTVKLLQKQNRFHDALWVMEFMQQKFPEEFASTGTSKAAAPEPSPQNTSSAEPATPDSEFPEWRVPELG